VISMQREDRVAVGGEAWGVVFAASSMVVGYARKMHISGHARTFVPFVSCDRTGTALAGRRPIWRIGREGGEV
jgi:hypothetical protein